MTKEILILVGISGSGKTSWATNFMKENSNHLRINRDDIRKTLVGDLENYYQRKDLHQIEEIVTELQSNYISVLAGKYNIILDNTNLKQKYLRQWIDENHPSKYNKYFDVKFKLFDCELIKAKQRVYERDNLQLTFDDAGFQICKETEYITEQHKDYLNIKKYLLTHHKDKIL